MTPTAIELHTQALMDDRLAEARHEHLLALARAARTPRPSPLAPVRRRAAASLRAIARRLDGDALITAAW